MKGQMRLSAQQRTNLRLAELRRKWEAKAAAEAQSTEG